MDRLLGVVLQLLDRYDEALEVFDRSISLDPSDAESHCNRGTALMKLGRFGEALEEFDKAIALRPGYDDAAHNRAVSLRAIEKTQ